MNNTRHLGVYGIIIIDEKILLVEKCRGAYTGKLDLPGGTIEHGETPVETLKREIDEETNLSVKDYTILAADSVVVDWTNHETKKPENMHHIGIIYDVIIDPMEKIKNDADGHDSLGASWYNITDLKKEDISPLTYNALKLKGYYK